MILRVEIKIIGNCCGSNKIAGTVKVSIYFTAEKIVPTLQTLLYLVAIEVAIYRTTGRY